MSGKPKNQRPVGPYEAIRDVLIHSMNKGQLLGAVIGLIILVSLLRMPADEIAPLWRDVLSIFVNLSMLGWIGFFSVSVVLVAMLKTMRRGAHSEIGRLADERTLAQRKAIGADVVSSRKPRE